MTEKTYCGYIALVGRPNVGKSTLLNRILGKKVSITSKKPQTTRNRILGIKTLNNIQAIYVDTPGIHDKTNRMMDRYMDRAASSAIQDVDVVVFMIDAKAWTEEDELVLSRVKNAKCPVILALNKIDLVKDKTKLLPQLERLQEKMKFIGIIPLSAKHSTNLDALEGAIEKLLPESGHFFPADQETDKDDKFRVAEVLREKIMRATGQEVPYGVAVTVEKFKIEKKILQIEVIIWVERRGQKIIIIGKKGEKLKEISTLARKDLEEIFGYKIFLNVWIKVREGWSDSKKALSQLGFG